MRTLRFHRYGDPAEVLQVEDAAPPVPGPGQVRVTVQACGLTPADWALCRGLFAGDLPRGIGLEVSGTVDAVGDQVRDGDVDVEVGDAVFGPAPFTGGTAGASEQAVLDTWFPRPPGLAPAAAAALPMAVETASRGLDELGVSPGGWVLVHGAGTTVGYAAVQIAIRRGARVIATAGGTYAAALRAAGAEVTVYGDGMADRVIALAGGPVDRVLDTAPVSNALPDPVQTPGHVLTVSDFAAAPALGVRVSSGTARRCDDVLGEYAQLTAQGRFTVPVAATFALEEWRDAFELSTSGQAHGKLLLHIS